MGLRIHADEFGDTGGGTLGAELKVTSADHLAGSTMETIDALRDAGVTGILLPGTPLALLSSAARSGLRVGCRLGARDGGARE